MQVSKQVYMRRQGGLTFWRLGRLGGSFYLARPRRAQAWRAIPAKAPESYPMLIRVRSIADLGAVVLTGLYGISFAAGVTVAALAMAH